VARPLFLPRCLSIGNYKRLFPAGAYNLQSVSAVEEKARETTEEVTRFANQTMAKLAISLVILLVAVSNLPVFHSYFCYLNYTPSINVSQAAVPIIGSQCFMLFNELKFI